MNDPGPYPENGSPLQPFPEHPRERRMPRMRRERITTLLVTVAVFAILAALVTPAISSFLFRGRIAGQLCSGRQLYLALRNYANDREGGGQFPAYKDRATRTDRATTSNEALGLLVPRYLDDKAPLFNKSSAWCYRRVRGSAFERHVYPGENDWVYVRGLKENSPSRWPILATAFAPGTTHYVADPNKPGGVWKGANAVVIWAGGSGEITENAPSGDTFFIPRTDKPAANAFNRADDWLNDDAIEILYPELPNAKALPPGAVLTADGGC
jgi:hypothetical protein